MTTIEHKFIQKDKVVVNTDNNSYQDYIQQKMRLKQSKSEIEDLKHRVTQLENLVYSLMKKEIK